MIDKELEIYYRNFKRMFASDGWKQLLEDLVNSALHIAWSQNPKRVTVNTCTLDHSNALSCYQENRFTIL